MAVAETVFGLELCDGRHYAIITWIEHTYNRRRRQRALGKLTPVEYELEVTPV